MKIISVLIVEDEPSIVKLYKMVLDDPKYKVIGVAKNGDEAVEKFRSYSRKPDIILMDYRMPLKNGIDAAKEIMQINSDSKIIFLSADETVKDAALSLGVNSFKSKPFSIERLINNIERAYESKVITYQ